MSLLLISENRKMQIWEKALLDVDQEIEIEIWPDIEKAEKIQFAVVWRHPPHSLSQFPNLKAVSSLGAGVDHILDDETLPKDVKICRIVDDDLISQMIEYLHKAILNYRLNTFEYYRQKLEGNWQPHRKKRKENLTVGVMGLGKIGLPVAESFIESGYNVAGWSHSSKDIEDAEIFYGSEGLNNFLSKVNVLICLLPLTTETESILNLELFKKLSHPAFLINAGRGGHLVEEDLIYGLDKGWLEGAQLDVFKKEPLPGKHPFWNRENIIITPHIAAETHPSSVAPQIIENYKRLLSGMPLKNRVERKRGY